MCPCISPNRWLSSPAECSLERSTSWHHGAREMVDLDSFYLFLFICNFSDISGTDERGGRRFMRDSPRSPKAKTNGSRFEGNTCRPEVIIPGFQVNKQTNKHGRAHVRALYLLVSQSESPAESQIAAFSCRIQTRPVSASQSVVAFSRRIVKSRVPYLYLYLLLLTAYGPL